MCAFGKIHVTHLTNQYPSQMVEFGTLVAWLGGVLVNTLVLYARDPVFESASSRTNICICLTSKAFIVQPAHGGEKKFIMCNRECAKCI